jgi:hypothetical protein
VTKEQKKHYDRTARLGCVLCIYKGVLDTPAELHHIRKGGKRDNAPVIPLCPEHHRGATGVHGLGSRGFTKYHGISEDLLLECTTHLLEGIDG